MEVLRTDVLIVGAGLPGLAIALQLARGGTGLRVVVADACASQDDRLRTTKGGGLIFSPLSMLWLHKLGVGDALAADASSERITDLESASISNLPLLRNGKRVGSAEDDGDEEEEPAADTDAGRMRAALREKKGFDGDKCR